MALLLPALQKVREASNRMRCGNNLKQVALAFHQYHASRNRFPAADGPTYVSAFTRALPFLENDNLAREYDAKVEPHKSPNLELTQFSIKTFLCPTMRPPQHPPDTGVSSYGVSAGARWVFAHHDYPLHGVHDGVIIPEALGKVRVHDVTDGSAYTLMAGEMHYNLENYRWMPPSKHAGLPRNGNTTWPMGYGSYSFGTTFVMMNTTQYYAPPIARKETIFSAVFANEIPDPDAQYDGPGDPAEEYRKQSGIGAFRSDHSGGCNFAFADGAVHFLRDGIDLDTYRALSTRAGGEVSYNTTMQFLE